MSTEPAPIQYEEAIDGPDQEQLRIVSALALRQLQLIDVVAKFEAQLKEATAELRKVQEVDLPDAMLAAGCRGYTLENGASISIKEDIAASLSEGKKAAAIEWLKTNGYGDIVSDDLSLSFGKGKEDQAKEVAEMLTAAGYIPEMRTNVNTATLKALIRELLAKGADVPMETLGAYQWRKAIIK